MAKYQVCPKWVSIHAPWEGCDFGISSSWRRPRAFQFTHPGKGATPASEEDLSVDLRFQFTHPGKGATSFLSMFLSANVFQFTHPGKGATDKKYVKELKALKFQFTHPGKGATQYKGTARYILEVSIHAPWEGCDFLRAFGFACHLIVSIHAPWEGCDDKTRYEHTSR